MRRLLFVLPLCLAALAAGAADVYQVDPVHSAVEFSVKHLVISDVKGRFDKFSGEVTYDPADPSAFKASGKIDVASINTAIPARDDHLRGPDFFDVAQYPEITFESSRLETQGGQMVVIGTLTMHGVSREITMPVEINGPIVDPQGKTRIGASASTVLNRQDYGLTWSKTLDNGGLMIGNDVKASVSIEAVRVEPEAPAAE